MQGPDEHMLGAFPDLLGEPGNLVPGVLGSPAGEGDVGDVVGAGAAPDELDHPGDHHVGLARPRPAENQCCSLGGFGGLPLHLVHWNDGPGQGRGIRGGPGHECIVVQCAVGGGHASPPQAQAEFFGLGSTVFISKQIMQRYLVLPSSRVSSRVRLCQGAEQWAQGA